MSRPPIEKPTTGWSQTLIRTFWDIWKRWHLNDMRAECEHQRIRGESWETHPLAICPDCGYALGSAWLTEIVPDNILKFLLNLPETDENPEWI